MNLTGIKLQKDLGLSKFKYVYIQKIIDLSLDFYIITLDSKFPDHFIGYNKIKSVSSTIINKVNLKGNTYIKSEFKLTPPLLLSEFSGNIRKNAIVIRRDLAGEYFNNKKLFEYKLDKNIKVEVI